MLVVTGRQRSGTSFMSRFLMEYGYDLGTTFWHEEINGGLESPSICSFYSKILEDPTFPFRDFKEATKDDPVRDFAGLDQWFKVQKFSFLLMNPKFVDIWLKYRSHVNDRFLVLYRDPHDIIASKQATKQRNERFYGEDKGDSLWLNYNIHELKVNFHDALGKLVGRRRRVGLLKFPDFLTNFGESIRLIEYLTGDMMDIKKAEETWLKLVDLKKVTFK